MGVKGAKNKKQQEKWNKFVSLLISNAGLPSTCLVRLIFMNSDGKRYDINNYNDLKELSTKYGDKTIKQNYVTMNIIIDVLALTFDQYQKRFKYEQQQYMKINNINLSSNNPNQILSEQHKILLSKFVLSPLTSTKAIIQKAIKPPHVRSPSESPSIMDMLHVNAPLNNKNGNNNNEENNDVLNDIFNNVVNPKQAQPEQKQKPAPDPQPEPVPISKPKPKPNPISPTQSQSQPQPDLSTVSASLSAATSILNQPKRRLAASCADPKISFEELRYRHYIDTKYWDIPEQKSEATDYKLAIYNWPSAMNKDTLATIFSPYGDIILSEVDTGYEYSIIAYTNDDSCMKAINALNGFQIGPNQLKVEYLPNDDVKEEPEPEPEPEPEQKEEPEEEEENRKLIIGNWPSSMGDTLLSTLFSPYGQLLEAKIVNDCGIIEYDNQESAEKALKQLNGFQMGANKLVVTFASNEISHILQMENDGGDDDNGSDSAQEEPDPEPEPEPEPEQDQEPTDDFERVAYPVNDDDPGQGQGQGQRSIFEEEIEVPPSQNIKIPIAVPPAQDMNKQSSTPNENDIEEMVNKENEKDLQQILHDEPEPEPQPQPEPSLEQEQKAQPVDDEEESSSESDSSYSDSSDIDSTDSEIERKIKAKASKKKLTKKQLRRLKRKEKKKRRRKLKKKRSRAVRKREKYVDNNINALNECLEKFTNLMSSVSQSAMVMQQSVAQMSQLHAQQQQQSMLYQQSMRSLFPNQPMYTSIIPQSGQQPQQPGPGQERDGQAQGQDISQSMQNIINQISNTQGGPDNDDGNVAGSSTPKMNTDMLNQQFLQQQNQLIQAQALQIAQMRQQQQLKSNNGNQIVNKLAPSSPILHSAHYSPAAGSGNVMQQQPQLLNMLNNNNNNNAGSMNLNSSGDNNAEPIQPGYNQSKSKIFEHKKALRNVSPEFENKLTELAQMGYTNRTFNLVLLKQENGDMDKVIENLKQFYKNT